MTAPNARIDERVTDPAMNARQRAELEAWKAEQLAKAPRMDEATARRVSAALFGTHPAVKARALPSSRGVHRDRPAA